MIYLMSQSDDYQLNWTVKLLAYARLLSSTTSGFILFCAPIHFVSNLGMPASVVGMGIGAGGLSGIIGRILGGLTADGGQTNRRTVILTALVMMTLGCTILAINSSFSYFVFGSILSGFGYGLFTPAADALIADSTEKRNLNVSYGFNRLANWLGLGTGLALGAYTLGMTGSYNALFTVCAVTFVLLIVMTAKEIRVGSGTSKRKTHELNHRIKDAIGDRNLGIYTLINIGLSSNTVLVMTTAPVYLIQCMESNSGFGDNQTSVFSIFLSFVMLCAFTQMPIAKASTKLTPPLILLAASALWAVASGLLWFNNTGIINPIVLSLVTVLVLSIASSLYGPGSSLYVVSIAPESARALYLSVNSMCWGIARLIAPAVGLTMVTQGGASASSLWILVSVLNAMVLVPGLFILNRMPRFNQQERIPVMVEVNRHIKG